MRHLLHFLCLATSLLILVSTPIYSQFSAQKSLSPLSEDPIDIEIEDIDGDGDLDVLVASQADNEISWYEYEGNENFGLQHIITNSAMNVQDVEAADLDGDGDLDILSASPSGHKVAWYENIGSGKFSPQRTIDNDLAGVDLVQVADLDGDGNLDILAGANLNPVLEKIVWYRNEGDGIFVKRGFITSDNNSNLNTFITTDLDSDGDTDILAGWDMDTTIEAYFNNGDGNFEVQNILPSPLPQWVQTLVMEDVDGDGWRDILVGSENSAFVRLYKNKGDNSFASQITINTSGGNTGLIAMGDLDQDGDLDLVKGGLDDSQIYSYFNDGTGSFEEKEFIVKKVYAMKDLALKDLNQDGYVDLFSVSESKQQIAWYANEGTGYFTDKKIVCWQSSDTRAIAVSDVNLDGYMDVLSTSVGTGRIAWYSYEAEDYKFSTQKIVAMQALDADRIVMADADGDGDEDVFFSCRGFDEVGWYENLGGDKFGERQVVETPNTPNEIAVADFDGDGDKDFLVQTWFDGKKSHWHENDGTGNFIATHLIGQISFYSISCIDLNQDGFIDIIGGNSSSLFWYQNDGAGQFLPKTILDTNLLSLTSVCAKDLDGDGDIDILANGNLNDKVAWYKNDGSQNFTEIILNETIEDPWVIHADDLDSDGDLDILLGSKSAVGLVWFRNHGGGNFGEYQTIENSPINTTYNWGLDIETTDLDKDGDIDIITCGSDGAKWYENFASEQEITTRCFLDENENGLWEENEKGLPNLQIDLNPSPSDSYSDNNGFTQHYLHHGEYSLSTVPSTLWELTTSTETYSFSVDKDTHFETFFFGFKPARILPRVVPYISSEPTRCSQSVPYTITYQNTGTTIAKGQVRMNIDELMDFNSAEPEPDYTEENTLVWNFEGLYPNYENQIQVYLQIPNADFMGESLETQTTVEVFNDNEELVSSKSRFYHSEVRCSYDPNDKLAQSNLLGQSEFVYLADTIFYTIRFQNTGNDVAFDIRVEDILDKRLDWTTFQPLTASHDFRTTLDRTTGIIKFYFDDIMLPDSTTDKEGSNGFVMFSIASLSDLSDKVKVKNTAYIFFDSNPPIVTNTMVNTLIKKDGVGIEDEMLDNRYSMLIRPNPFSDYTTIEVGGLPQGSYRLEVIDILGRKVQELKIGNRELQLDRGDLESGLYLIQVLEEESSEILGSGKVLVE